MHAIITYLADQSASIVLCINCINKTRLVIPSSAGVADFLGIRNAPAY